MIKKGSLVFLLIFAIFLGFVGGMLVGRQSKSAYTIAISQEETVNHDEDVINNFEKGKININTASVELLQSLPNIGKTLAQRIVDYRVENGVYSSVDELLNIEGIGDAKLNAIRPYITIGG